VICAANCVANHAANRVTKVSQLSPGLIVNIKQKKYKNTYKKKKTYLNNQKIKKNETWLILENPKEESNLFFCSDYSKKAEEKGQPVMLKTNRDKANLSVIA
jgi:uncharacterized HAD superfamily protein